MSGNTLSNCKRKRSKTVFCKEAHANSVKRHGVYILKAYSIKGIIISKIYLKIFKSSCRAISVDIPDPVSPPLSIAHCFQKVFSSTCRIGIKLRYGGSSWSSYLCSSIWSDQSEYITNELVCTSPFGMSVTSNFDSFRDGWKVLGAAFRTCSQQLVSPKISWEE